MECLLFSSNDCRLVADTRRSFHYLDVTSLKLWRQIKGYCYSKPYFRTYVYNFRTKSIQINNLYIYLLKNVKNWKCENLPIRALFLRCASYDKMLYCSLLIPFHSDGLLQMVWNCPFCILRGCWSYNINLLSQVESGEKKSEQFDITWKTMHRFRKTKFWA